MLVTVSHSVSVLVNCFTHPGGKGAMVRNDVGSCLCPLGECKSNVQPPFSSLQKYSVAGSLATKMLHDIHQLVSS